MTTAVHIGNNIDKSAALNLSKTIQDIFYHGFKNHMSDPVIISAIDMVKVAYKVENVTVQGSTFHVNPEKQK
jgi:hypothetical protein